MTLPTRVITGSRRKAALLALALFPGLILLDPGPREDPALLWSVLFFVACGAVGAFQLIFPSRLTLSAEGFEWTSFGRRWSVRWRSIERLVLWRNPAPRSNQTLVGWLLRPEDRKQGALEDLSRAMGVDGALPGMWTLSPTALFALMQSYHAAATAAPPASP